MSKKTERLDRIIAYMDQIEEPAPVEDSGRQESDEYRAKRELFRRLKAANWQEARSAIEALFEAVEDSARSAPEGWQPIETAPTDGFIVLLADFRSGCRNYYVGHFASKSGGRKHWLTIPGAWERSPSHWQPLPAPPRAALLVPQEEQ